MGAESLITAPSDADNDRLDSEHENLCDVLSGDLVPRNSSGVPEDTTQDLGSTSYRWKKLFCNGRVRFAPDYDDGGGPSFLEDSSSGGISSFDVVTSTDVLDVKDKANRFTENQQSLGANDGSDPGEWGLVRLDIDMSSAETVNAGSFYTVGSFNLNIPQFGAGIGTEERHFVAKLVAMSSDSVNSYIELNQSGPDGLEFRIEEDLNSNVFCSGSLEYGGSGTKIPPGFVSFSSSPSFNAVGQNTFNFMVKKAGGGGTTSFQIKNCTLLVWGIY